MVCVGCGESPGVPLHPFESGSPICGWCLRLSRQRDDVRSSRTASKFFLKKVLTNQAKVCYNKSTKRSSKGCLHKSPIPCGFMSVPAKNQLTRFSPSIFSEKYKTWQYNRLAQLVEQRAFNPWVWGSSPQAVTTFSKNST